MRDAIQATVSCAMWLVRRGHPELAMQMREEFMRQWGISAEEWDAVVDELTSCAESQGDQPKMSLRQLEIVRVRAGNAP